MCQPVGGLIELAVGHGPVFERQRHRVRRARRLRGEQARNGHRLHPLGQHRLVAPLRQPGVLGGVEQIHRRQAALRVRGHRGQQPLQPVDHRLDGVRVVDVGAVFGSHGDPGALAGLGEAFGQ
ncbi:hypothetical protein MINTM019_27430 [Mycobacterium paraintracellulare]|nr:hypothetical protein MINTM019_27430 [Mycobacterium paraintracellulare]